MSCDCPCIEKVAQTKYLGVVLDQALSWYPHLEQTSGRIRKLSWIFKTLRHIVPTKLESCKNRPRNLLNEIYVALAQSVLLYCIPIWGGAAKTKFIHLERAQRALIKLMYFKNKSHTTPHYTTPHHTTPHHTTPHHTTPHFTSHALTGNKFYFTVNN